MQHTTSITIKKLIADGYRITREMSNGKQADSNISICELKKRGAKTIYALATNSWADCDYESWREAKKAMNQGTL